MRKMLICSLVIITLMTGCGRVPVTGPDQLHVAIERQIIYSDKGNLLTYTITNTKVYKAGNLLGIILMRGTSNVPTKWYAENFHRNKDIRVYSIPGIAQNLEVAVHLGGVYYKAMLSDK